MLYNSTFWAQTSFSFIGVSNGYFSDTNVIVDIDNDGDDDIISTAIIENRIYLHTNNGDKTFQTSVIASNDAGVKKVVVADIDLDNDIDIIFMSNNYINFYENVNNVFRVH